jgi:hypothetical protein
MKRTILFTVMLARKGVYLRGKLINKDTMPEWAAMYQTGIMNMLDTKVSKKLPPLT